MYSRRASGAQKLVAGDGFSPIAAFRMPATRTQQNVFRWELGCRLSDPTVLKLRKSGAQRRN